MPADAAGPQIKPVSDEVRALIYKWAGDNNGKIYAPVLHPEFAAMPAQHGSERFDMIEPYLDHPGGTVLDIGANWGYISSRLADLGYKVTAIEVAEHIYTVLDGLREASGRDFKTVHGTIFELPDTDFDIVIALNIFHHFLKKKDRFENFNRFLQRLNCKTMIFQSHRYEEPQMRGSYHNLHPEEFVELLSREARLPRVEMIASPGGRNIYRLRAAE